MDNNGLKLILYPSAILFSLPFIHNMSILKRLFSSSSPVASAAMKDVITKEIASNEVRHQNCSCFASLVKLQSKISFCAILNDHFYIDSNLLQNLLPLLFKSKITFRKSVSIEPNKSIGIRSNAKWK